MNLNRATLIGNVTQQPELKVTPSGHNVSSFSVATNMTWKDAQGVKQTKAEYHNIVAWGKLAEICSQYLTKGSKVFAEGRLQTREWETQDGQKRRITEIVLENMIMLDRKGGAVAQTEGAPAEPHAQPPTQEIRIEDIPF